MRYFGAFTSIVCLYLASPIEAKAEVFASSHCHLQKANHSFTDATPCLSDLSNSLLIAAEEADFKPPPIHQPQIPQVDAVSTAKEFRIHTGLSPPPNSV